MRTANNRRAGGEPLTDGRRRALIKACGSVCEMCGATSANVSSRYMKVLS
jgi:hypothetical protein